MSGTTGLEWSLAILAVWRVTHLLWAEDGPADVFARLPHAAGAGTFGGLLDCFYCVSVWVALPVATWLSSDWSHVGLGWLGVSGGACLLERATARPELIVTRSSTSTEDTP